MADDDDDDNTSSSSMEVENPVQRPIIGIGRRPISDQILQNAKRNRTGDGVDDEEYGGDGTGMRLSSFNNLHGTSSRRRIKNPHAPTTGGIYDPVTINIKRPNTNHRRGGGGGGSKRQQQQHSNYSADDNEITPLSQGDIRERLSSVNQPREEELSMRTDPFITFLRQVMGNLSLTVSTAFITHPTIDCISFSDYSPYLKTTTFTELTFADALITKKSRGKITLDYIINSNDEWIKPILAKYIAPLIQEAIHNNPTKGVITKFESSRIVRGQTLYFNLVRGWILSEMTKL